MWNLTPAELLHLKGNGERFAHFIDRLIRAEAACTGLPQAEIGTQMQVNVPDGGVDTVVRKGMPESHSGKDNERFTGRN